MSDYKQIATESRKKVLELVYKAQTSHIGSLFSCADIFAVLFEKIDLDKDKFILSAGWKACMLYYHLWRKGRITLDELNSYNQEGSKFIGLTEPIHPDIPFAGGSMGMGLPAAVGFALAKKLKGEEGTVYCLMSDGELAIGTTWESILIATQHKLGNLVVIVDRNRWQAMDRTENILPVDAILNIPGINGHDYKNLELALTHDHGFGETPIYLICNTIKGKGVSLMENNNIFHYKAPTEEEYNLAMKELNG